MSSWRRISDRIPRANTPSPPPPRPLFPAHSPNFPLFPGNRIHATLARHGTHGSSSFTGRMKCLVVLLYPSSSSYYSHPSSVHATGTGSITFCSDLRVVTRSRKYARPNVYTAFARPPDCACRYRNLLLLFFSIIL